MLLYLCIYELPSISKIKISIPILYLPIYLGEGQRVECPKCGHKFKLPTTSTENVETEQNNSLQKTIDELKKQLDEKRNQESHTIGELRRQLDEKNNQEIDDEIRRQIEDQARKEEQDKFRLVKLQYEKLMEKSDR